MKPSTIKYFIREGFSNVGKNMLMTIASILAVSACVSILSFSFTIGTNLNGILKQMEDSIGISAFLSDNPNSTEIDKIRRDVLDINYVDEVKYISPNDALVDLMDDWGADEEIFAGFSNENNPLSHSLQISITDIEYQDYVLNALGNVEGIETVRHGQSETEAITKVGQAFNVASAIIMIALCAISIMIIINTIRISVVNRRIEINIMKYVGATDWFIKWPFILEGSVIGFIGAIIPIILGIPVYIQSIAVLREFIPMIDMMEFKLVGEIYIFLAPVAVVFGVLLGVFGSMTSIKKHLKV